MVFSSAAGETHVRKLIVAMIALFAVLGAGAVDAAPNVAGMTNRTVKVGTLNRTFIVHVGRKVGTTMAAPVVFMFHGTGGDGERFYGVSGWREKADAEGLIAVFPDALTYCYLDDENRDGDFTDQGERQVFSKWASGQLNTPAMPLCPASDVSQAPARVRAEVDHPFQDDVLFVDAMVAFLKANYTIDDKRLYASGFSNGAQFVARLAAERSQVFAALAAHAGNLTVTPKPARSLPFLLSVGSLDDRFARVTGVPRIPIAPSLLSDVPVLKTGFIAPMLAQLGLADASTYDQPMVNGVKAARLVFDKPTGTGKGSLTFVVIDRNDHAYPNGQNHPVVMANVVWAFFAAQKLP
jgi:polyhydroxybutyrate depolymerase